PSGEELLEGDHVRYLGEAGTIEFVATERSNEEAADWYVEKFRGDGVMIKNKTFGRVFLSATDIDDHLEFVSRRA
ncbi:MAG TPA: hypothetical protein VN181_00860, partial [Thermoanaerobaculia bacterium]|nr:hypothetical protein [Thermoanaerobaculia bacterium]